MRSCQRCGGLVIKVQINILVELVNHTYASDCDIQLEVGVKTLENKTCKSVGQVEVGVKFHDEYISKTGSWHEYNICSCSRTGNCMQLHQRCNLSHAAQHFKLQVKGPNITLSVKMCCM